MLIHFNLAKKLFYKNFTFFRVNLRILRDKKKRFAATTALTSGINFLNNPLPEPNHHTPIEYYPEVHSQSIRAVLIDEKCVSNT